MARLEVDPKNLAMMLDFPEGVEIVGAVWSEWGRSQSDSIILELKGVEGYEEDEYVRGVYHRDEEGQVMFLGFDRIS